MAPLLPIQAVEAFHLAFLRILESKLDRAQFVVKGGVNLRGWFASRRYSEDLDIDVLGGEVFEIRDKVDATLSAPPLERLLRLLGLTITRTSKPKQTETTQPWKLDLAAAGRSLVLNTKIEFSRRASKDKDVRDEYVLDPVLPDIVRPYGLPAPTVNHYTAASASRQKIGALIGRRVTQARDVWDLDHLFRTARADPRPLPADIEEGLSSAADLVIDMPYDDFKAQVVPYLAPEDQDVYGTPEAWARIQELVVEHLLRLGT